MSVMEYWKGDMRRNYAYHPYSSHNRKQDDYPEEDFSDIEHISGYPWSVKASSNYQFIKMYVTRQLRVYKDGKKLLMEVLCLKSNESELWQCNAEMTLNMEYRQTYSNVCI